MDRMVTPTAKQAAASQERPVATRSRASSCYRLLHSTGEVFIKDRAQAIDRLASLPGAKLFVLSDYWSKAVAN